MTRTLLTLALMSAATQAHAQDLSQFFSGFQQKTAYEAPSGRYHVQVPGGLVKQINEDDPDPDLVVFSGEVGGVRAQFLIKRQEVTPGAASSQLMLTTRDNNLSHLPNFTVEQIRKTQIAHRTCAVMRARYDYQGNKAYPMAIEQAYVIDGSDGFVLGMEVSALYENDMIERMKQVYASFVPVPKAEPTPTPPPAAVSPPATKKGK